MRITAVIWFGLFLFTHSNAGQAQLRERRDASNQYQITVTLKLSWNVTTVGKPIPASYTTQVSNGTALADVLNKAANDDRRGPYDKYSATYFGGLGNMIIAMNGIEQDPDRGLYWIIYDMNSGQPIPVGMDLYKPEDGSTTIFRFTSFSAHSSQNSSSSGYNAEVEQIPPFVIITVSIGLEWNVATVGKPIPSTYTTNVTNGTFLVDILNEAARVNTDGPFNRYSTTYFGGLGHLIIAMNGTKQDPETGTYWMIYDKATGKPTPIGIDGYQPKNGSGTIFRLVPGAAHGSANPSAQLGFIFLCFLAIMKSVIFI